jgi:predicted transposase YdaD
MAKKWDRLMKMLAGANPQHFVNWVIDNGIQFDAEMARELTARAIEADVLFIVVDQDGQKVILHIEFQTRDDPNMGKRVWEYNGIVTFLSGLPVYSFVVYLKETKVAEPYYEHKLPNGEISHRFYYSAIKLWEIPGEIFKQPGMEGLLPLLPLTKNGTRREVVEEMIAALQAANKEDLLPIAYAVASLVFTRREDKKWLKWRFDMLHDILEESWAYQEMTKKERQEGKQEERTERLQGLRQVVQGLILNRFPLVASEAQHNLEQIQNPEMLQRLIIEIATVQTAEGVRHLLLEAVNKK